MVTESRLFFRGYRVAEVAMLKKDGSAMSVLELITSPTAIVESDSCPRRRRFKVRPDDRKVNRFMFTRLVSRRDLI